MSSILRSIKRSLLQLEGKERWYHRVWYKLQDIVYYRPQWYYKVWWFKHNLPMFVKMAWNYRTWDFYHDAEVLHILLQSKVKMLAGGPYVNSNKYSKRCATAAGWLRKAYLEEYDNRAMNYLMKKNPINWETGRLKRQKVTCNRIYEGMTKVAWSREDREIKSLQKQCWDYINKYSDNFGD